MPVYVPRTSTARKKLQGFASPPELRTVTLDCGCSTTGRPEPGDDDE